MAKNNYWTIDGVDEQFDTLWRAKISLSLMSTKDFVKAMKPLNYKYAIRHWINGEEVAFVLARCSNSFTKSYDIKTAKEVGIYFKKPK